MREIYDGLRSKLSSALKEINRTGKLTGSSLSELHMITDTIKNIDKIEMLEENDNYSQNGGRWEATGSYDGGNSYGRRGNYVRGYYRNGNEEYSRNRNGCDTMIEQLEYMLNQADGSQRDVIKKCLDELNRC